MSKHGAETWKRIIRWHQERDTENFNQYTTCDWVREMFIEESRTMERVGQVCFHQSPGTDYLVILYRPLDKGKSKEIWHIVAVRHHFQSHNDRWHAADGWWYSPYMKPRNTYDRRQLRLFEE